MRLPNKCIVDTNVPKTANLAITPDEIPDELAGCVLTCIEAIKHVMNESGLVIDAGDEIFDEYRRQLSMSGQPGMGDVFMRWVHEISNFLSQSMFTDQPAEGLYLRFEVDGWLIQRAKLVRSTFSQSIDQHWSRSNIKPNQLYSTVLV